LIGNDLDDVVARLMVLDHTGEENLKQRHVIELMKQSRIVTVGRASRQR
jgi:hypothetical protein